MKAPSPAFSLYPKDILSDEAVAVMSDEELGVYIRLLCHAWLEGSIPTDHTRLARMTRRSRPGFERIWRAIGPCWKESPTEPGRLIQGRLEREREKQAAYSAKQSARGSHGGRPRLSPSASAPAKSRGKAAGKPEETRTKPGKSLPSPSPSPSPHITENVLPAPPAKKSWTREAAEDWDERFGQGSSNPGRIGLTLGKVVKAYGWPTVRPAWRRYLVERDPTFATPNDFAGKFKAWLEGSVGADDLEAHNRREAAKAIGQARARDQRDVDRGQAELVRRKKSLPAHEGFGRVLPPKD